MKTNFNSASLAMALALFLPALGFGRADTLRDYQSEPARLTPMTEHGVIQYFQPNQSSGETKATFTDARSGETWRVRNPQVLKDLKLDEKGTAQVHMEAAKSPRFLLGESYVVVSNVQPLANPTEDSSGTSNKHCKL